MPENPFFSESPLPYHMPPFDRITDGDYIPAFEKGMADQLRETEAIASNPDPATFENTIVAMERSGRILARVSSVFFNLKDADTSEEMKGIEVAMAPRLSAHSDAISQNAALFRRILSLNERRKSLGLDAKSLRLLERYHRDFVRAGALLPEREQVQLKALNAELAGLLAAFGQNVLNEKNSSSVAVRDRAELDGLSDSDIAALADDARSEGRPGEYAIRLSNTTGQPLLHSIGNRGLRERVMRASLARGSRGGPFDNRELLVRIAKARARRAGLLGYESHAAFRIEDQTARTVDAVDGLLRQLVAPAAAKARREAAAIQAEIDGEGGGFRAAPWDWDYYAQKVRRRRYDLDESQLKPYFELNHVLKDGLFFAANRLYGLTFTERHDLPVYRPDVRVFEVFDADDKPLALFLEDFYARPSKMGGAWMNEYVLQSSLFGDKPVVANHQNFARPAPGEPTLLSFEEVVTLFHEFGHGLHGMLSDVRYPRFSGTNVPRDFVEFPSEINEMWAVWPEVVANYARHYKTGEPMPAALLEKMLASRKFNKGYETTEYLESTLLDLGWHTLKPDQVPGDAAAFETLVLERTGAGVDPISPRYRAPYFSHAFSGGYSAGYYAYIWAEVIVAESIEWFRANGGLTRKNGDHFRATVLSRGASVEPMDQFHAFAGKDPDIGPLIRHRGLDEP